MAFQSKDLSVLVYANGFTLWHYATPDLGAEVDTEAYFNSATDMFRVGDMVLANVDTDGTPALSIYLISGNSNGVVCVANIIGVSGG